MTVLYALRMEGQRNYIHSEKNSFVLISSCTALRGSMAAPVSQIKEKYVTPVIHQIYSSTDYKLAFPLGSKGRIITRSPAAMNSAPLTYTGAAV